MNSYNDILRRCKHQDRRAQLEFYSIFYKGVYNSCFRILGNPQESEEIMQETFLKVFDRLDDYEDGQEYMLRILKRIAINASIDLLRKRKVQFVELNETHDYIDFPDEQEETELQLEAIRRMMEMLPEGYRLVITLHLIEGMEYDEIARQLHLSSSSVRSQFTRGREKLKKLIKEHYYHENIIG